MKFSLRTLLLLFTGFSLAIPALYFARPLISGIVLCITVVLCGCTTIKALVAQGSGQAGAIGFAVLAFFYVATLVWSRDLEQIDPRRGQLPTTKGLAYLYSWAQRGRSGYLDDQGKFYPLHRVTEGSVKVGVGFVFTVAPHPSSFHTIGHCQCILLCGTFGWGYAMAAYERRETAETRRVSG